MACQQFHEFFPHFFIFFVADGSLLQVSVLLPVLLQEFTCLLDSEDELFGCQLHMLIFSFRYDYKLVAVGLEKNDSSDLNIFNVGHSLALEKFVEEIFKI